MFPYGDAVLDGSASGTALRAPIIGIWVPGRCRLLARRGRWRRVHLRRRTAFSARTGVPPQRADRGHRLTVGQRRVHVSSLWLHDRSVETERSTLWHVCAHD